MWKILEQIWELPWYEVLVIAACDDAILFVKIWPVYVFFLIIYIFWAVWEWKKWKKN